MPDTPVKIAMGGRTLLFWFLVTVVAVGCTDFSFYSLLDGDAGGGDTGKPLVIIPEKTTLRVDQEDDFRAEGGTPPYSFAFVEGGGRIESNPGENTAMYTAPSYPSSDRVKVVDDAGNEAVAQITVIE